MNIGLHSQTYRNPSGSIAGSEITTNGLASAFSQIYLVHHVYRFGPSNYSALEKANLDLLIIEGWHANLPRFIQQVKKTSPNVIILFWNLSFLAFNEVLKLDVDGYLSNSKKVVALLNKIRPAKFVMLAADINSFLPLPSVKKHDCEVSYLGLYHKDKSEKVVDLIIGEADEFDLAIYGSGWDSHPVLSKKWKGRLPQEDIAQLYSSSKIVLGTTEDRQRKAGMINNRVFEALACGCCFISEYFEELERVFGEVMFFSKKAGDTRNQIQHILSNYESFHSQRLAARKLIQENHTYHHRVKQILEFYRSFKDV